MGEILLYLSLIIAACSLLVAPWVAGLAYLVNSLMQPQYIWDWIFSGVPIYKITAALGVLGLVFASALKKASFEYWNDKQNLALILLWIWMHLSHLFSPFKGLPASVSPEIVLSTINSIMIMYFILIPLFYNKRSIIYLCYAFVFVGLYYTYWANSAYLSQEWHRFVNGRLVGPNGSPYLDGNVLSTVIIMCLPFIMLLSFRAKNKLIKISMLLAIPLAWHAVILFGSRGALLASIISLLAIAMVIRSKKANVAIGVSFAVFMVYQGSLLLTRATDTVDVEVVQSERPINPRLVSWEAGLKLIPEYPLFGAGVQMFEQATSFHFPGKTPHVAHNTFINFSANTGLLTGLIFIGLIFNVWRKFLVLRHFSISIEDDAYFAFAASSISIFTFFVSSMFLDLIIFEPFYIALMINLVSYKQILSDRSSLVKDGVCKAIE